MSDKMRWRYGDTNPLRISVAAMTVVEIGDIVWVLYDEVFPASAYPLVDEGRGWMFRPRFAGVAMQRSRMCALGEITVATSGTFEFPDKVDSVWKIGDLVSPSVCIVFKNQEVEPAIYENDAIGTLEKKGADGNVLVRIVSGLMQVVGRGGFAGKLR